MIPDFDQLLKERLVRIRAWNLVEKGDEVVRQAKRVLISIFAIRLREFFEAERDRGRGEQMTSAFPAEQNGVELSPVTGYPADTEGEKLAKPYQTRNDGEPSEKSREDGVAECDSKRYESGENVGNRSGKVAKEELCRRPAPGRLAKLGENSAAE